MTKTGLHKDLWSFITTANQARRVNPDIDFKEIERIHKEWERYDISGRMVVVPNDPKGPKL